MSSFLDSEILGSVVIDGEDETQEDVNEESILIHDQSDLIDLIRADDYSKHEIIFLINNVAENSNNAFWSLAFKEILKTFSLNTLKNFVTPYLTDNERDEVIQLIKILKIDLKDKLMVEKFPESREEILKYIESIEINSKLLSYAIRTVDNEDLKKFIKKINRIV